MSCPARRRPCYHSRPYQCHAYAMRSAIAPSSALAPAPALAMAMHAAPCALRRSRLKGSQQQWQSAGARAPCVAGQSLPHMQTARTSSPSNTSRPWPPASCQQPCRRINDMAVQHQHEHEHCKERAAATRSAAKLQGRSGTGLPCITHGRGSAPYVLRWECAARCVIMM